MISNQLFKGRNLIRNKNTKIITKKTFHCLMKKLKVKIASLLIKQKKLKIKEKSIDTEMKFLGMIWYIPTGWRKFLC